MQRTAITNIVFGYAFRPLFALLGLQGLLIIPYWALAWSGLFPMPAITINPLWWHGHEMLFGFAGAAIAGFLLTAVANWTKRPPVAGYRLLLLCVLWLFARLAWCLPSTAALPIAAALDLGFDGVLLVLFVYELIVADNRRNLKIGGVLLLYTAVNAGFYFALLNNRFDPSRWLLAALYLIILLINIIGGRVIPLFTGNWLRQRNPIPQPPVTFNRFDLGVVALTALFMLAALAAFPGAGILGVAAGLAQLTRLARWQGWRTVREPLLWSLHLGYAWLGVGLLLNGLALLGAVPASAGIHALTVGAISGLILAMSARAALGHTGRTLTSSALLTVTFISINLAALVRILAALLANPPLLLWISAGAWFIALAAYSARYFPILLLPAETPVSGGR